MVACLVPNRVAITSPCTPHQRLYIRTLLAQLEIDTRRCTIIHRRFWLGAGLQEPALGTDLDAHLCTLTRVQASALVAELRKEVPDEAC